MAKKKEGGQWKSQAARKFIEENRDGVQSGSVVAKDFIEWVKKNHPEQKIDEAGEKTLGTTFYTQKPKVLKGKPAATAERGGGGGGTPFARSGGGGVVPLDQSKIIADWNTLLTNTKTWIDKQFAGDATKALELLSSLPVPIPNDCGLTDAVETIRKLTGQVTEQRIVQMPPKKASKTG